MFSIQVMHTEMRLHTGVTHMNKVGGGAVMRCICPVCVMALGMEPRACCVRTRLLFFLCGEIADLQSDGSGQSPILALGMLRGSREILATVSGEPTGQADVGSKT